MCGGSWWFVVVRGCPLLVVKSLFDGGDLSMPFFYL